MPFSLVEGVLMAVAAVAVLVGVRFLIALADDKEVGYAARVTGRWSAGIVGAAAAAGATGLVQLGDAVGMITMLIGSHPLALSNGLVAGLGAFALGGFVELSPTQYIGASIALIGAVMLLYEVAD